MYEIINEIWFKHPSTVCWGLLHEKAKISYDR